ncbi:efflux RND transporter permease subunit [Haloarchaeobius sp. HRN-SO-5]|uniref:efflux RND transporter permease subunit n=1 Tax=Haloarchaeobius sp. HRN-SO-5 TaxID=3446118 RepID=UPI003EB9B5EF
MSRVDDATNRVADLVVERPVAIVVAFLLLTVVFAVGLGNISTEAGTSQFTEDSPAQQAFDRVNRDFEPTFEPDEGTTQLIHRSQNVLSRRELVRMLRILERLEDRPSLRVASTTSPARTVARTLDPNATTLDAEIRAVEDATEGEIDRAVRRATRQSPGFSAALSEDFNRESASASASISVVRHRIPAGLSETAGAGGTSPLTDIQLRTERVVESAGGDVVVFGSGILSEEFSNIIGDSLLIVIPAALVLILVFLVVAYRDLVDLLLGLVSLGMALVWTIGFLGLANIAFTQLLIAVPPLLLAVGIDFGLHTINRYREERVTDTGVETSMRVAARQLLVAFGIVTTTTVIGFASNATSGLAPIRDFGIVAAIGIVFTFLIFGVFLPAAKVLADRFVAKTPIPQFSQRPLGSEGSALGSVLTVGVVIARRGPVVFLVLVVALTAAAGYYGTGVDTSFSDEDFLPPEDIPDFLEALPEPFAPGEYTVTATTNFLERNFAAAEDDTIVLYVEGPMRQNDALEMIQRANRDPPESFVTENREARSESLLGVIRQFSGQSESFRRLVARNDPDDDGIPERNLERIYEVMLDSPVRDQTLRYITPDFRSTRVVYTVEADASQSEITDDAREQADRYRFEATATGSIVVFQDIAETILASAIRSLVIAFALTAVFLVLVYYLLAGRPSLGVVNLVPIAVTLALIAGSMRLFGVPFNALTATILSITLGLGIDYSAHIVHRFVDEFEKSGAVVPAISETVRGTGGALTGSMLTTTAGTGVLVLAITPVLGQFGLLTALSVFYSYLTGVVVTPSALVIWARFEGVDLYAD